MSVTEYDRLLEQAKKNRWVLPQQIDPLNKEAWVKYWIAKRNEEMRSRLGRSVLLHRTE